MRITAALGIFLIVLLSAHARAEVDWPPKRTKEWKTFQALIRAVDHGNLGAVRKMVRQGADVDGLKAGDDFVPMDRPLMRAARRGDLEMVKVLLKAGANPNWCCCSCVTALHRAIRNHHVEVVRRLLKAGADPRLLYDGGTSCLDLAKQAGDDEVVELISSWQPEKKPQVQRPADGGVQQGVEPLVGSASKKNGD
jgi:hypothetical protein